MDDTHRNRRAARGRLAAQVDVITLAALTAAALLVAAEVTSLGAAEAADRIGCGLNAYVNAMMAYPRPCHAPTRKQS